MGTGVQALLDELEAATAPSVDEARFYGWQPLPLLDFYREGMDVVGSGAGRRFLDIGSGIGSKMRLAYELGWCASGIELRPEYVEISRRLFPALSVTVVDAFEFDEYDRFDLVYCYRPCVDPAEQDTLNRLIAERMAPGALFFSAGGPWPEWLDHVGGQVWRITS